MKKKVFWLAAMAVTVSMASCSLEEVVEQPTPQAIGFSSFVGKPTKAATEIVGVGGSGLTTFYVYGAYGTDGTNYAIDVFDGNSVTVTNVNTPSTPTGETKYWVANKQYKFVAYSNGNSTHNNVSFNGDDKGHITITDYEAGTSDLILAERSVITTDISGTSPGAVELEFKHLLSQVAFEFKNGFTNGYKVAITGLQFDVPNKATYSYQSTAYSWGTPATDDTKEYAVNGGAPFANAGEAKLSEYNFVIPQDNSSINASFTVTVYESDGSTVVATKSYNANVSLATGTTTDPTGGSTNVWTPGYKYKYTATITADILGDVLFPIQFTVTSVDTWKDSTASDGFGLTL